MIVAVKGNKGSIGQKGNRGSKGDKGDTGIQGDIGDRGLPGDNSLLEVATFTIESESFNVLLPFGGIDIDLENSNPSNYATLVNGKIVLLPGANHSINISVPLINTSINNQRASIGFKDINNIVIKPSITTQTILADLCDVLVHSLYIENGNTLTLTGASFAGVVSLNIINQPDRKNFVFVSVTSLPI